MDTLSKWIVANPTLAAGLFLVLGGFLTTVVWPVSKSGIKSAYEFAKSRISRSYLESKYLDWLVQEHRYLPILPTTLVPVTEGHQQELDRLYVSLAFADGNQEILIADTFKNSNRLIVLGEPGAGKTTMLRFLTLTIARARRNRPLGQTKQERKLDEFRVGQARRTVNSDFQLERSPLPIFVYLNRLRDVADWPKGKSLLDAIRDEWKAVDSLRPLPDKFLDARIKTGDCIFLFDAFDELGTQEARDAIARLIGELANAVPSGNRFITTSRIVGYSGQLAQHGFRVVTVQRLSSRLMSDLVTNWYETLKQPTLGQELIRTLERKPRLRELATNPMLLSLIVLVQYVKRIIPDRRDLLYDECVRVLVERRFAPPAVQAAFNDTLDAQDALSILQKLARGYHEGKLREMSRVDLENAVGDILTGMVRSPASKLSPTKVIMNIEQRSQLLIERGLNDDGKAVLAFSHLTFQEYLTAAELKRQSSVKGNRIVCEWLLKEYRKDPQWWEEVALLYAAQLDASDHEQFFKQLYP